MPFPIADSCVPPVTTVTVLTWPDVHLKQHFNVEFTLFFPLISLSLCFYQILAILNGFAVDPGMILSSLNANDVVHVSLSLALHQQGGWGHIFIKNCSW